MNNVKNIEVEIKIKDLCVYLEKENDMYKIKWVQGGIENNSIIYTKDSDISYFITRIKEKGNINEKITNKIQTVNIVKIKIDNVDTSIIFDKYLPNEYELIEDFIISLFSQIPFNLHRYLKNLKLESEYAKKQIEII